MRPREQARLAAARRAHGGQCVELGDGVTHYRIEGSPDAQPLILVHGATVPLWEFDFIVPELVALGRGCDGAARVLGRKCRADRSLRGRIPEFTLSSFSSCYLKICGANSCR